MAMRLNQARGHVRVGAGVVNQEAGRSFPVTFHNHSTDQYFLIPTGRDVSA